MSAWMLCLDFGADRFCRTRASFVEINRFFYLCHYREQIDRYIHTYIHFLCFFYLKKIHLYYII